MFEIGTTVRVEGGHGTWIGRVTTHHTTHNGEPNGISRVEVLDPQQTRHRVGDVLDVGTLTLRPAEPAEGSPCSDDSRGRVAR
ncbi:hypothetical protein ABZV93_04540 [Actinopolymorpha sp. NPDC004070]|uniref:hypothetical protein n=1 Tax=Actinopolymorpha sp. NPDC004070 TaxID=3154548 RepID=UPI0033A7C356